jgi:hypothetical protein
MQGLPSSLGVGVGKAKTSGVDEPWLYVGVKRASSHKDQQLTPKGAEAFVFPVNELWRIPYSDAL